MISLLTFGGFLAAAWLYRRRPQEHKRFIMLATWSLAVVGFERVVFRTPAELRWWLAPALYSLPVLIGIAHDLRTTRHVHAAWWIGLGVFVLRPYHSLLLLSPPGQELGRQMLDWFGRI